MTLVQDSKKYVVSLFSKSDLPETEVEYNLKHSEYVIKVTKEISKSNSKLIDVAAWFHDVGKINGEEDHAKKSLVIANEFLKKKKLNKKDLELICDCIQNHGSDKKPVTDIGKAFQAADKISFLYLEMAETYVELSMKEGKTREQSITDALKMLDGVYSKVKPDFKPFAKEKYEEARKLIQGINNF